MPCGCSTSQCVGRYVALALDHMQGSCQLPLPCRMSTKSRGCSRPMRGANHVDTGSETETALRPSGHTQTRDSHTLLGAVGRGRKPELSSVSNAALCPSQLPAFSILAIQSLLSSLLPLAAFGTAHAEEDAAEWKMGLEQDAPPASSKRWKSNTCIGSGCVLKDDSLSESVSFLNSGCG